MSEEADTQFGRERDQIVLANNLSLFLEGEGYEVGGLAILDALAARGLVLRRDDALAQAAYSRALELRRT